MVKMELLEEAATADLPPPPHLPSFRGLDNFGIDAALFELGRAFPDSGTGLQGGYSSYAPEILRRHVNQNGHNVPLSQWGGPPPLVYPSAERSEFDSFPLLYDTESASDIQSSPSPEPGHAAAVSGLDTMGIDLTPHEVRDLAEMCDLLPNIEGTSTYMLPNSPAPCDPTITSPPPAPLSPIGTPPSVATPVVTAECVAGATEALAAAIALGGDDVAAMVASGSAAPKKLGCPYTGCKMAFSRPSHLEKHMRTHTNERPHSCPTCDMAFKTKWTLKKHLRIHSGERPFVCDHPGCGKDFTQRGTYKRHLRLHSDNAQVFECHCGKTFKQRSNYNMHLQSHSTTRDFTCEICSKSYKSARSLEKHHLLHFSSQKTADGDPVPVQKQYCRYCAKAFHYIAQPDGSVSDVDRLNFEAHEASHTATRQIAPTLNLAVPQAVLGGASAPLKQEPQAANFVLELC